MFDLYPDILTVVSPVGDTADASGDYSPWRPDEMEYALCRAIRNASAQSVRLAGGTEYRFSYVVYMPAGTPPLKLGTQVGVYAREGNVRIVRGRVADFVSGPLGCKLWL